MRYFFLFSFLLAAVLSHGQTQEDVVLTIDGKPVYKSEFESIFKKNNKDSVITKDDIDEYLALFINFKLKVAEAESLGMDTLPRFRAELMGYRAQLANPYMSDHEVTDALVEEAWKRSTEEVDASHILIKVDENAVPADTLKAWNRIAELRKQIVNGADFGDLARRNSEDPSAKDNAGRLGYFSAFQMVYPFESMAYNTPVGEVSKPVRTRFGYHILKIHDKREARGEIRVAHIMVRSTAEDAEDVKEAAKKRIDELHTRVQNGEDFGKLAQKFSDDRSSGAKMGELPPFGSNRMVEEFETAAFALENDGDISEPIQTQYGWHIIKRLERIPIKSFEESHNSIRARIAKDQRSELSKASFIAKLKKEYNFEENPKLARGITRYVDTTLFSANYKVPEKPALDGMLFRIGEQTVTQRDFLNHLEKRQTKMPGAKQDLEQAVASRYEAFREKTILDYEDDRLEEKYPEFKQLLKEYHDGILLFDLTDDMVWSRAVKDTVGLEAYYESHKADYMYPERADAVILAMEDEKTAKAVRKSLKKGSDTSAILAKYNAENALSISDQSGILAKDEHPIFAKVAWQPGVSDLVEHEEKFYVVSIKEILAPAPKPLSEVRGLVTAAYQTELEKTWIEALRKKYKVEVNRPTLYTIQ